MTTTLLLEGQPVSPLSPEEHIAQQMAQAGAVTHTRAVQVAERDLYAAYRSSAAELTWKLAKITDADDALWTRQVLSQVERTLGDLTVRSSRILDHAVQGAAQQGILGEAATTSAVLRVAGFSYAGLSRESLGFRALYDDAVRALYGGTASSMVALSPRIWNTERVTLNAMQRYIADAMLRGTSRGEIVQKLRSFLLLPHVDLRTNKWREFFRENPPGAGVYRSAYKNTERLLRTELNRAYRVAQTVYARGKPYIIGMRWKLSEAHPEPDICDVLARADPYGLGPGVYPPGACPDSAHPHCLCRLETIYDLSLFDLEPAA